MKPTLRSQANLAVLIAASVILVAACGDDDQDARGDVVCSGVSCQCPGTGDCEVDCESECDLSCTGSGDCDFVCGANCLTACPGSGACRVDVGDTSTVSCSGSGGCDVACHGDCTVDCPGSGTCIARCDADFTCAITRCNDVVNCPDGVLVCNGSCPP